MNFNKNEWICSMLSSIQNCHFGQISFHFSGYDILVQLLEFWAFVVELLLGILCKHNSSTGKKVLWNFFHHRFLRRILFLSGYSSPSKTVPWGKFLQCIIVIPSGKFFPGNNSLLCTLGEAGLLSWNFSGYLLHTLLWILIQIQCPPSIFWFLIISTYNILRFDIEKKLIKS